MFKLKTKKTVVFSQTKEHQVENAYRMNGVWMRNVQFYQIYEYPSRQISLKQHFGLILIWEMEENLPPNQTPFC